MRSARPPPSPPRKWLSFLDCASSAANAPREGATSDLPDLPSSKKSVPRALSEGVTAGGTTPEPTESAGVSVPEWATAVGKRAILVAHRLVFECSFCVSLTSSTQQCVRTTRTHCSSTERTVLTLRRRPPRRWTNTDYAKFDCFASTQNAYCTIGGSNTVHFGKVITQVPADSTAVCSV